MKQAWGGGQNKSNRSPRHMTNEYWTIIYRTTNNSDF